MKQAMGIRFIQNGPIMYFEKSETNYQVADKVIVKQGAYDEFGEVVIASVACQEGDILQSANLIQRKATAKDLLRHVETTRDAAEALQLAKQEARRLKMDMKMIGSIYSFDRQKLTFLFSAPKRIDFRAFVRELATVFRVRIELRQIGARDESKYLGGIGPCGRPLCCSTFLADFFPVSIRMAKNQGLSLNNAKLSGLCGRLLCCLEYENDMYEALKKTMPDYGTTIETPEGKGKVVGLDILAQIITVTLFKERKTVQYAWEELAPTAT
ncbi:hypothetical protein BW727_101724 [Jeotgalibaca dankookensis]|uniref:PSP1 C-terminal domain-containing protein n=1 Tax=Jeotgalibaca dankookensis TaxID=708126 RepID=A0A1S6IRD8_9LACT|nr:stage 0 sporulation family protein [Jeotgalibaca dankookensis]AQS54089.1 hypothetical protein BW727_101724 [Jeotgalibaca dankookensis]